MYKEEEWLRLLFLLSDTQTWLHNMEKDLFHQPQVAEIKKLFRRSHYITATAFAHIIERHYYKIPRHPAAGKFTVPVCDILYWLRESVEQPAQPLVGTSLQIRQWDTGSVIGFDRMGNPTTILTTLTEVFGQIKTAFPGEFECRMSMVS